MDAHLCPVMTVLESAIVKAQEWGPVGGTSGSHGAIHGANRGRLELWRTKKSN